MLEQLVATLAPEADTLRFIHTPALAAPVLTGLHTVVEGIFLRDTALVDLQPFESLHKTQTLSLTENPRLARLGALENLQRVGDLIITANIALPTCEAEALRTRLAPSGRIAIADKDDAATCD
jgi:hypothetical protein